MDLLGYINKLKKSEQEYFMKMYEFKIYKCDYQHKPPNIPKEFKLELKKRNIKQELDQFKTNTSEWNNIKEVLHKNKEWFSKFDKDEYIENWNVIDKIYILFSAFNRNKFL